MNQKEFNSLLNNISDKLNPLNQLLYQAFILIVFYYFFDTITHLQTHKSFIVLTATICIILDVCIWNNINQTILFVAILTVYISYNINKDVIIDTFINTMNISKNNYNDNIKHMWEKEELERKQKNEIEKITFTPKNLNDIKRTQNENDDENNTNTPSPDPYDKTEKDINEINLAYKETKPTSHLTDSRYAKIMLNKLYTTPQYKNIKKDNMDEALDNNIHYKDNNNNNNNDTIITTSDKDNIELFRKPKKVFLDDTWLTNEANTYNDNCNSKCKDTHHTNTKLNLNHSESKNKNRNKNAICSLVKFGYELSECTNQDNTITDKQLHTISNNNVNIVN